MMAASLGSERKTQHVRPTAHIRTGFDETTAQGWPPTANHRPVGEDPRNGAAGGGGGIRLALAAGSPLFETRSVVDHGGSARAARRRVAATRRNLGDVVAALRADDGGAARGDRHDGDMHWVPQPRAARQDGGDGGRDQRRSAPAMSPSSITPSATPSITRSAASRRRCRSSPRSCARDSATSTARITR